MDNRSNTSFCIVGTDTDVGKTVVTAGLLRQLRNEHIKAQGIKIAQTGCISDGKGGLEAPDISTYHEASPTAPCTALYKLKHPCSPHLAADQEGKQLTKEGIIAQLHLYSGEADITLIEGAGGLFVPINQHETILDVLEHLNTPVILVVANRLGAINHALLSVEALNSRGMKIIGIIITHPVKPGDDELDKLIIADNIKIIGMMSNIPVLASIPYCKDLISSDKALQNQAWNTIAKQLNPVTSILLSKSSDQKAIEQDIAFDKEHLWHPYTSMTQPLPVRTAVKTRKNKIFLQDGTELIDGMASWWAAIHGYNHPYLLAALKRQGALMPHIMFGGLTHNPAITLGRKLLSLTPSCLRHVFFADSGSVAVEVALKMAVQYFQAEGKSEKNLIITPRGGYHGDTLGAMSVCDPVNGMHSIFQHLLPQQLFISRPECAFHAPYDPAWINELTTTLQTHGNKTAAIILEPIVQGAGGMWFYHPDYLKHIKRLCDEYDILLILDEIATGFGRTGKMFACEWADIEPDIMCVGKALTGGMLGLAATLTTSSVAYGISKGGGMLMHGPTFMANPLACAVATASLKLLSSSPWQNNVKRMEQTMKKGLETCRTLFGITDVRVLGGIGVVEMEKPVNVSRLQDFFIKHHAVWIRPFGKLIYIIPPYSTPIHDIERLTFAITHAIGDRQWE